MNWNKFLEDYWMELFWLGLWGAFSILAINGQPIFMIFFSALETFLVVILSKKRKK